MNNMENTKRELTIIMPALNEEANIVSAITHSLRAMEEFHIDGEIVAINDGSTDATQDLIEQQVKGNPGKIIVIRHERPKGIGMSFWEGVDHAGGDVVVMLPGDDENDPMEIFRYFRLLEHVDIVIPFLFNREIRPFFRNILSWFYRMIINTTFLVNFNYTNGTVLYRKSVIREISHRSSGFFFQTDILVRAARRQYLFAEVPYRLGVRKKGVSKAISFPSLLSVIKGYLKLVKDFYFSRECRNHGSFSSDSQTARRRQG